MSCYISSNNNRFFVALEQTYGAVASITGANRIPAVKLEARQRPVVNERRDKTGSRTFGGLPAGIRRKSDFKLNTLMTAWSNQTMEPSQGPLFGAAMGGTVTLTTSRTVSSASGTQIQFTGAHGLTAGQAITFEGELRFVSSVASSTQVVVNAPFTAMQAGSITGATANFKLTTDLKSASVFDYWDPSTAVQRILCGSAVDTMRVLVNGDFHEFEFKGPAQDVLDSASFESGQGALSVFPDEPASPNFNYTIVPGHLGQVWMGAAPNRFFTLTDAEIKLDNNLELRDREFGSQVARCLSPGRRRVTADFRLFEQDDEQTRELYQAARERSTVQVMFQLGQQSGQLFGVYLPSVVPEVPEFDDSETRLQWRFENNQAQGGVDDELYIAFG
jgi:hypothetical protein